MVEVYSQNKKDRKKEKHSSAVYRSLVNEKESGIWRSFAVCPPDLRFETQEKDEKIILLLRQHPVVNVAWMFVAVILAMAPSLWEFLPFGWLPERFQAMTVVLWYFLVLAFVLERFLNWYFNVYIVTDERIVDIDFNGLIYRDISVTKINNVQDVNFTQAGGLAAFFNYGDVYIQTAAEQREFDFLRVPKPGRVSEILYMLQQEEELEAIEGRVK